MKVKSEYFRCMSNFIYSYENLRSGTSSCMKEKRAAEVLEAGTKGRGVWKVLLSGCEGVKASRVLVTGI